MELNRPYRDEPQPLVFHIFPPSSSRCGRSTPGFLEGVPELLLPDSSGGSWLRIVSSLSEEAFLAACSCWINLSLRTLLLELRDLLFEDILRLIRFGSVAHRDVHPPRPTVVKPCSLLACAWTLDCDDVGPRAAARPLRIRRGRRAGRASSSVVRTPQNTQRPSKALQQHIKDLAAPAC